MDRPAAYRLEQLVPLFNATDSPDQLGNLVAEAGQILYGTLHDGTLVIDGDDIRTVAVSICDSKREYQRTLWDDGKLDFSYRLLFQLVSDSISERQRTIYHLKWSDGAGGNIQQTDWENDYKHQGQRYALCCTQLAAMLTVEPAAPAAVAVPAVNGTQAAHSSQASIACTRIEHLRQQFLVVGDDAKLLQEAMIEGGLILVPLIEAGTLWGNEVTQGYIDAARKPSTLPWDNSLSEFSYQSLFQTWAIMFSDRQRIVLHTVSSSNGVTFQTTRTEDAKQQAHRYASFCSELVEFLSVLAPEPEQPTIPVPAQPVASVPFRKRTSRTNPTVLRSKLDAKIGEGYQYQSIAKLKQLFGGAVGTWSKMIQADDELKAWSENKSVQAAKFADVHTTAEDVYMPDDEMEKLFENSLKELPEKDRPKARAAFAGMDQATKQRFVQAVC